LEIILNFRQGFKFFSGYGGLGAVSTGEGVTTSGNGRVTTS